MIDISVNCNASSTLRGLTPSVPNARESGHLLQTDNRSCVAMCLLVCLFAVRVDRGRVIARREGKSR